MVYHKETKNKQDVCCLYVKSSNEGNIVFTMISFSLKATSHGVIGESNHFDRVRRA